MIRIDRGSMTDSRAATTDELTRFAACIFEPTDIVEIRRLPSGESSWHMAGELPGAVESLVQDNQCGQHIYVGANPRRMRGGTKSKDVELARCFFVDFDGINSVEARRRWHSVGLPTPTMTIGSGHGIHAYWRLAKPMKDLVYWSALQKRFIALLDSDTAIHDPARLMRLPGFTNHKEPVAACRIIDDAQEWIYDLNYLIALMYSVITESDYLAQYQAADRSRMQSRKSFDDRTSAVTIAKLTAAKWPGVAKGGRNHTAFQNAAYLLKNLGLAEEQAWPILWRWNCKNKPPLPERELRQVLRNADIYGRHEARGKAAG